MLKRLLAHPLTTGLDIDSPQTTQLRARIIQTKPFLRKIYEEWYRFQTEELKKSNLKGVVLELGSGAGFLHQLDPDAITSDIFKVDGLSIVLDGQALPFARSSLAAVLMTNVLHHVPNAARLFAEAERCLFVGGCVAMVEPWLTAWSRFVYRRLHHEPLDEYSGWVIQGSGPLSGANSALPWIVFQRDRSTFETQFPQLTIKHVSPYMPFRYLVSGGISLRSLMPGFLFPAWKLLEILLSPLNTKLGMFAKIVVRKSS